MRRLLAVAMAAMLVACSKEGAVGPQGPTGPQGPAGAQGPPGPAGAINRVDFTGTIGSSGGATAPLPAAAVANNRVPVIACYISDTRQTWLAVAQTPTVTTWPYCGLSGIGTGSPSVTLVNVPIGYFYFIIAAW